MNTTTLQETDLIKIQNILVNQLNLKPEQVTPEASIMVDLSADSLDVVEISMAIEDQFNVTLPDESMDKITTVGDLYEEVAIILELKK